MQTSATMNSDNLYQGLRAMGVSKPHASLIANGKREPGMKLAVRIYTELGVKLGPIKKATPADIRAMSRALAAA